MSDSSRKSSSIPSWQQSSQPDNETSSTEQTQITEPPTQSSHAELVDQAREFLKDESIRNAPRERKVAFLEKKGLQASDIEQLLDGKPATATQSDELKTVHDSNENNATETQTTEPKPDGQTSIQQSEQPQTPLPTTTSTPASTPPSTPTPPTQPQRDIPPIITYPEFLLKPQKPPPLITIPRLIKATYSVAGLAALTYSASKYIIEPMVQSLTEARHSLATTTLTDLEQLNTRLESSVSHVPYIASAAVRRSQDRERDEDLDSVISDPTELFHRDIATQTTPSLSRTQSRDDSKTHLDATTHQVQRLSSLHDTLSSLVATLDPKEAAYLPAPAHKKLRTAISDLQSVLDKLESTYNPFRGEWYSNAYLPLAESKGKDDVAAKVKNEIRALKGAFLSARNFPSATRMGNAYPVSR